MNRLAKTTGLARTLGYVKQYIACTHIYKGFAQLGFAQQNMQYMKSEMSAGMHNYAFVRALHICLQYVKRF